MKFGYEKRRNVRRDDVYGDMREYRRLREHAEWRRARRSRYINESASDEQDKADLRAAVNDGEDISTVDISQIEDLSYLFAHMEKFNQNITDWDTSNVVNMDSMFFNAKKFNQDLYWCVNNVETMDSMFCNAVSFNNGGAEMAWETVSLKDMDRLFCGAKKFNRKINANGNVWDVSNVVTMEDVFMNAVSFDQDIGDWDVSNVEDMSQMFDGAVSFNNGDAPMEWDVSSVEDANFMFHNASSFCQDISSWNFDNVKGAPRKFLTGAVKWNNNFRPESAPRVNGELMDLSC